MSWQARALNLLLRASVKRKLLRLRGMGPQVVAAMRADLERSSRWVEPLPPDVRLQRVDASGVPAEWVLAGSVPSNHALLYLHGGAYLTSNPAIYRDLAARLSRACGARVLLVDYRLAPEHPFPAALEDARSALGWLREQTPMQQCAIAGDSAGGGLALATLAVEREAGHPLPACGVVYSPWTDLAGSGASVHENARLDCWLAPSLLAPAAALYLGDTPATHPHASPLYAELAGLPALQLHAVAGEILRDDTLRFVDRARAAGVAASARLWRGLPHAFPIFGKLVPEARECIVESGAFVRAHWPQGATAVTHAARA